VADIRGRVVAMPQTYEALREDCGRADLIVTELYLPKGFCIKSKNNSDHPIILDQRSIKKTKAATIFIPYEKHEAITVVTSNELRGDRPWVQ
jgi:hypothetical protein